MDTDWAIISDEAVVCPKQGYRRRLCAIIADLFSRRRPSLRLTSLESITSFVEKNTKCCLKKMLVSRYSNGSPTNRETDEPPDEWPDYDDEPDDTSDAHEDPDCPDVPVDVAVY